MPAAAASRLAPGIPPDYYESIHAVELEHWWHLGMRRLTAVVLGDRLTRPGARILDAGCGTGGFLRFALDAGSFSRACGIDLGAAAIELARTRVPEAELAVGALVDLPYEDGAFDLVATNDVLQHVAEDEVDGSLRELRRVLAPGGAVFLRTNGSRRLRRERDDWRAYDSATLRRTLEDAGFRVERLTYVNLVPSLWALVRGGAPHAPTEERHGIAPRVPPRLQSALGRRALAAEARYLAHPGRRLPYGHSQLALAVPAGGRG